MVELCIRIYTYIWLVYEIKEITAMITITYLTKSLLKINSRALVNADPDELIVLWVRKLA